jgi:hypothetical protein
LWSYETDFAKTGLHFVAYDGDHSKCGINTMFNTGTAVGVRQYFWKRFPRNCKKIAFLGWRS